MIIQSRRALSMRRLRLWNSSTAFMPPIRNGRKRRILNNHPAEYVRNYFKNLTGLFDRLDTDAIVKFIDALENTRKLGGTIFLVGNGGSAATCSHFANDLIKAGEGKSSGR